MEELISLFEQYGYVVVAVALLVEQVGAPVPAFPVLVVAGALVAQGKLSGPAIAALAVAVVVAGDLLWFQFGRRYGSRILALICRISLSPDRCVSQTEQVFAVLGLRSLLVARFVPGLSAVAPSMAGLSGYTRWRFVVRFEPLEAPLHRGSHGRARRKRRSGGHCLGRYPRRGPDDWSARSCTTHQQSRRARARAFGRATRPARHRQRRRPVRAGEEASAVGFRRKGAEGSCLKLRLEGWPLCGSWGKLARIFHQDADPWVVELLAATEGE
jgi:hypothetical protein